MPSQVVPPSRVMNVTRSMPVVHVGSAPLFAQSTEAGHAMADAAAALLSSSVKLEARPEAAGLSNWKVYVKE